MPTGSLRVAAIQMTSREDVEQNLAEVERLVVDAAGEGARLVVLPECFAYLGPEEGKRSIAEPLPAGGPILRRCQALARRLDVELVLGGFWEAGHGEAKVRNACVVLGADGLVRAVYRKIHLFDVDLPDGTSLRESDTVEAGDETVVVDTRAGRLGLSICYDLRFPELYRRLVDAGATVLAVPAAFTATTGKDHWHVLVRARAIEAQCFVVAAAQTGWHYGRRASYGHALVVDPWGCVVADAGDEPGFALARLELSQVSRVRAALPALAHRRLPPRL